MNETGINNIIQINKNVFSQYLVSDIISDISLDNNKIKYLTFHWNLSISEPWINMNLCNMNFQFIDNITWFFNIRPSLTWDANITSLVTWEICLWDSIGWGLIQVWYWKSHVKCNLSWIWNRWGKKCQGN